MCISTKVNTTAHGKNENSHIEANKNNNKEERRSNAPVSPRGVPTSLEVLI